MLCYNKKSNYNNSTVRVLTFIKIIFKDIVSKFKLLSVWFIYTLHTLLGSGMSILSYVALRMVTQAGLDTSITIYSKYIDSDIKTVDSVVLNDIEGVAKKSKMKSRKERLNRNRRGSKGQIILDKEKNKENSTEIEGKEDKLSVEEALEIKAAQIYSLCTHSEQRKSDDYLKRIIMSMFLKECLKKANFFKKCNQENGQKCLYTPFNFNKFIYFVTIVHLVWGQASIVYVLN